MCRELKSKDCITKVLKEAHYKTIAETELMNLKKSEKLIDEDFDLLEAQLSACSKFTLSLTGPDFTSFKVEDPFKRLGPIAIFSARRHWTAPRSIRLQKGSSYENTRKTHRSKSPSNCSCKRSSYDYSCDMCSKYNGGDSYGKDDNAESFGFHVRGDAPVIISHVEINSLADVRISI